MKYHMLDVCVVLWNTIGFCNGPHTHNSFVHSITPQNSFNFCSLVSPLPFLLAACTVFSICIRSFLKQDVGVLFVLIMLSVYLQFYSASSGKFNHRAYFRFERLLRPKVGWDITELFFLLKSEDQSVSCKGNATECSSGGARFEFHECHPFPCLRICLEFLSPCKQISYY
jgi:hypothetical protein